jgi:membrane associated rhomboid family serine protease
MGAYLVLFPRNRVNAVFLYHIITVPALVVLGMWIVMQLFRTVGSIASTSVESGGVAYLAHVGGFLAGVLAALPYRMSLQSEPDSVLRRQYLRDPEVRRLW